MEFFVKFKISDSVLISNAISQVGAEVVLISDVQPGVVIAKVADDKKDLVFSNLKVHQDVIDIYEDIQYDPL